MNPPKKEDYKSRKFVLTCVILLISTVGLFTSFLTGAQFVSLATLILTIYGGANVYQKTKGVA